MKSSSKSGKSGSKSQESETIYLHPEDRPPVEDEEDSTTLDINQDDNGTELLTDDSDLDESIAEGPEEGADEDLGADDTNEAETVSQDSTENARDADEHTSVDGPPVLIPESIATKPRPSIDYSSVENKEEPQNEEVQQPLIPGSALMKKRVLMGAIFAFAASFALMAFLIMRGNAGPEKIEIDQLVEEAASGVIFQRPDNWLEADFSLDVADKAFTPEGESINVATQSIIMKAEALGVDFSAIDATVKQTLLEEFEKSFSDPAALEGGPCEEMTESSITQEDRPNYEISFTVVAVCGKLAGSIDTATLKMAVGISGSNLHTLGLIAPDDSWEVNGEAFDHIVLSMKPVL